jgi:6-phosphogluconolactonase
MTDPELMIHDGSEALAAAAAQRIHLAAVESIATRGRFLLCLSGGSTPRRTYELLARMRGFSLVGRAPRDAVPHAEGEECGRARGGPYDYDLWSSVFLFFGDERFVPPDDDRSNYKMVREALVDYAQVPADHVFAIPTCGASAQQAADAYAGTLRTFFGNGVAWPEFDLVLLGLGEDGHTASLFPGAAALQVTDRWVTFSPSGAVPPPVDRVTLTFPALNAARQVMFLVSGAKKAEAFAEVYQGRAAVQQRPAMGIRPASGRTVWFVDRAAAGRLERT